MSPDGTSTPAPPPANSSRGCGGACFQALVIVFVLGILAVLAAFFGPPVIADFAKYYFDKFRREAFTQDIQETFREHVVRISSTNGNILEVAVKESAEEFDRRTELQLAGVKVPFFDTTVTAKTRATFRYHIKLDGGWRLRKEGAGANQSLIVIAPKIEPTLPVAFDSRAMESELKGWWIARYHQELSLEELRKGLTSKLEQRAKSQESIESVREASRHSVGMFVKNWLVTEDQWRAEGINSIKVLFPDEEQKDTEGLPPTIELDKLTLP